MTDPAETGRGRVKNGAERHRERLWALAYRMLASPDDADDAVQETFLRWHRAAPDDVREPEGWLITAATRICLDKLRSRQAERSLYVGPWLPTPTLRASSPAPDRSAEIASELSIAFLLLLERLGPEERAAFLLREVFDVSYAEVATAVGKSEDAARQMVHRARRRVRRGRRRFQASIEEREQIARQFAAVVGSGDPGAVRALLDPHARLITDGGGKAWAARRVISGATRVSRGIVGAARKLAASGEIHVRVCNINGEPAILTYRDGRLVSATALEIVDGLVSGIYRVLNPDKLQGLDPQTNVADPQADRFGEQAQGIGYTRCRRT